MSSAGAKFLERLLEQRRMILSLAFMLSLAGLASWFLMIRQEDPFFPYRAGTIITPFPGSDPARIERLVVKPLEEELAQIEEIEDTWSRIRTNVALTTILLKDHVYDTDAAWDKVRRAIKTAQLEYPDGVLEPELDDKVMDASTVVFAVTGSGDPIELLNAARKVKQRLYKIDGVSRIELFGEPGEQVNVLLRDADANRLNMSPQFLASQLQSRNELVPGGSVRVAGKSATLRPNTEFTSIDEIRRTPIQLANGEYLPLEAVAEVRYGPKEPSDEEFWWNSQRAVGISLVAIPNKVNSVAQGEAIRQLLPELRAQIAPLEIHEMFFQPDRVKNRLQELSGSLLSGVFIVAGVLFFFMGLRLGLVVASIVPLVTFTAVAVYSMGGGVLHQVAVIGMVVALGMLVDNAIVMGENIQYRLDAGDSPSQAATTSVKELAAPLGTATGTTLAAFVPMLMSNGNAADFTRGIPVMVMLTLTISYFFAVLVTPILASWGLRANPKAANTEQRGVWERIGSACGNLAVKSPWLVVVAAVLMVVGSGAMMQLVHKQFFPYADRNQLLIEVALPEGTHLDLTRERMSQIEGEVSLLPQVKSVYSFVGTTGPRFYYNLPTLPRSPNKGRLVVITESHTQVPELMDWVRDYALGNMPDTEVVPRQLGQGPPITAPVEIRVYAEEIANLELAVEQVYEWLREAPGAVDVRHDLGVGVPSLKFDVNDAVAMRYGHSRQDVATTLLGRTQGIEIGQFRAGDDPVPIKIRSRDGENFPVEQLPSVNVYGSNGPAVPLMQMSNIDIEWQPGAILRRDFSRYATVSANLEDGYGHEQVLAYILPKIAEAQANQQFPPGASTKLGGEADASGDANSALLGAAPIGLMMLLFFLLLEFNSFRRVAIIMATVPLVMIGVIPGLVITGSPFGFNSMVGCIALVGIVVNNAIVLIDVIDVRLKEGGDLALAIKEAVARRTRPIILTTFTTVAGLSPLTVTSATAWPPMAWAIISGLLASTVLTLVVIPALCKILLQPRKNKLQPQEVASVVVLALLANFAVSEPSYALGAQHIDEAELQNTAAVVDYEGAQNFEQMAPISLLESIQMAAQRPAVLAELARTHARKHEAKEAFRRAWMPSLSLTAYGAKADRESNVMFPPVAPGGPPTVINVAERERYGGTLELRQTLFNAANGIYRVQAAKLAAQAQGLITFRQGELATTQSSPAFLQALSFEAQLESARAALNAQKLQLKDAKSLAKTGRLTDADLQLAKVQLLQIEHHLHELESEQRINLSNLARAIGSPVLRKPVLPVDRVWDQISLPGLEEAYEFTRETREDLRAQRLQIKALEKQRAAVGAEALPSLGLAAQYTRNEGQTFQAEEEAWVGAQLSWQIAAGGARLSKRQAIANEYAAVKQELLESERTLWFDLLEAAEHFHTSHEQVALLQQAVSASQAALNNQRKRQKAGLASGAAVAQASAQADEQLASLRRAKIAVIGHWLHFHVVMGSTVEEALNKYGPGIEALEQAM
jgi:multidrug efflux pump subunit AcrB/outer membrane protein TolC